MRSRRAVLASAGILLGAGAAAVLVDRTRQGSDQASDGSTGQPTETPNRAAPTSGTATGTEEPVASSGSPRVVASRASFGDQVSAVALGNRGYGFVVARASHLVFMLNSDDGVEEERFLVDGEPCFLTLTPDESILCVTMRRNGPGAVVLIDVEQRKVIATVPVGKLPNSPGMSPDGLSLHVPCEENNTIWMVDIPTRTSEPQTSVNPVPQELAVSADGRRGYVPERGSRSLAVLDLTNHTFLFRWTTGGGPAAVVASPDGERVFVANADDVSVSAVTTGGIGINTVPVTGSPTALAISPDGRHLYAVCSGADTIDVISTADLVVTGSIRTSANPVDISPGPDGRFAWVACSGSGELNIVDTAAS
jgi:DNA-binding beta-propeller fold protein YncE